ncbi:hypothetical protein SAMN02745225_02380, partial [Ferrithrix thermotolerans DSM 19514]
DKPNIPRLVSHQPKPYNTPVDNTFTPLDIHRLDMNSGRNCESRAKVITSQQSLRDIASEVSHLRSLVELGILMQRTPVLKVLEFETVGKGEGPDGSE